MNPKKENKQIMHVPLELKELQEDGHFIGYASVFDNVDSYKDVVLKGAFTATLKKNKGLLPILADHNPYAQIGWNVAAEEDDKGLKVEGKLNLEVQLARERYALVKQAKEIGAKYGLSIGYVTKVSEWDEKRKIRELKELDLWEYSFVTFPANARATVVRVKTLMEDLGISGKLTEDPKELETFLREVGFSNSLSKKIASDAIGLHKKEQLLSDTNLREADVTTVREMLRQCRDIKSLPPVR